MAIELKKKSIDGINLDGKIELFKCKPKLLTLKMSKSRKKGMYVYHIDMSGKIYLDLIIHHNIDGLDPEKHIHGATENGSLDNNLVNNVRTEFEGQECYLDITDLTKRDLNDLIYRYQMVNKSFRKCSGCIIVKCLAFVDQGTIIAPQVEVAEESVEETAEKK